MILRLTSAAIACLCSLVLQAQGADGDRALSEVVDDYWRSGDKAVAAEIALARLSKNPNDLASMVVLYDYGAAYSNARLLRTLIPAMRTAGANAKGAAFAQRRELLEAALAITETILNEVSEEELAKEAYKGDLPKRSAGVMIIEALEQDGMVEPVSNEELHAAEALIEQETANPEDLIAERVDDVLEVHNPEEASVIGPSAGGAVADVDSGENQRIAYGEAGSGTKRALWSKFAVGTIFILLSLGVIVLVLHRKS